MKISNIFESEENSAPSIETLRPFVEIPEHGTVFANNNELILPIICRGFRIIEGQQVKKTFECLWERIENEEKIDPNNENQSIEYPFGQKTTSGVPQFDICFNVSKDNDDQYYWNILFLDDKEESNLVFSSYIGRISHRLVILLSLVNIQMRDGILKNIKRWPKNKSYDYQIDIKFNIRANIQEVIPQARSIKFLSGLLDE